jgi:hypothetical protein
VIGLRVEQAIFGEQRGGHALRLTSGDKQVAEELASRLDLPDTAPPGVSWSPFISGFPHGNRYIFARTLLDPKASRAGMVFSHALLLPLPEVIQYANIGPIFDHLLTEPTQPDTLPTLDLTLDDRPHPTCPELIGVAEALATRGTGPVVYSGIDGFDNLIVQLWSRLWPDIRGTFAFRLSFGPNDISETTPPIFVCTPPALISRWRGYRIAERSGRRVTSAVAAFLLGDATGGLVSEFSRNIGAQLQTFGQLPLLEQLYRITTTEPDTFGNATGALRLVDKLSPDRSQGSIGKRSLLHRLAVRIESADATDILTLRNLRLDAFCQPEDISSKVRSWLERNPFAPPQDEAILSILEDATRQGGAIDWWQDAVITGIRAASRFSANGFATAVWRWAILRPSILGVLFDILDVDVTVESRLIDAAPATLDRSAADAVRRIAHGKLLPRLHGIAASMAYAAGDAIRLQIAMESPQPSIAGLSCAARNATPTEVVACALAIPDPSLLQIAGKTVSDDPTLLAAVDMTTAAAQALWATALNTNSSAWSGPADPSSTVSQILENLLDGGSADIGLLTNLAKTPLGNLGSFPRRSEVWGKLPSAARTGFLNTTAKAWLDQARTGSVPYQPEPDLEGVILASQELDTALAGLSTPGLTSGIQIVSALPRFDEAKFLRWMQRSLSNTRAVAAADAEALGHITLQRMWHHVLDEIVYLFKHGREDLRPALRICVPMLDFYTRLRFNLSPVTAGEKWESLETLAVEIYPNGPDQAELWDRAGGSNADLPREGNGRSRWHATLAQMRHGGRGLRIDQLLGVMLRDYPRNDRLRFLAGDEEFRG